MPEKKRILYLSNSYPHTVSGVTTVAGNVLRWMAEYHHVAIICPNSSARFAKKSTDGITHYHLPGYPTLIRKDVRFITPNPLQIQKVYDDFTPDIVHLHDPSPASMVLKDLSLRNHIPVIFSHHFTPQMVLGYLPESLKTIAQNNDNLNRAILQLTCRMYENASRLIVPTHTVKKVLSSLTHIPISVISSGIDCAAFSAPDARRITEVASQYHLPRQPFAFYLGRLDPDKNLHILLQAWAKIISHSPHFRLVIAGEGGMQDKLQELSRNLGIANSITWTGLVPSADLPYFYHAPFARAFVIPSPIESQSIVSLMALAAGLPVVAANAGALPEIVIDSDTGFLCQPDKPDEYAKKISYLFTHPEQANKMGQAGRNLVAQHDFPLIINQYLSLYSRVSQSTN